MSEAARALLKRGVARQVVIHLRGRGGRGSLGRGGQAGILELPSNFIVGATGAGDAFAAGYLFGIHEGWSTQRSVELGVCAAAACLTGPTPSGGLRTVDECLALGMEAWVSRIVAAGGVLAGQGV